MRAAGGSVATPDVIIVGGGTIGLGIAWRARQKGLGVTVVDGAPVSGAASVAAGMLAPVTEVHYGEEALLRLNLASSERYASFARELEDASGVPTGYRDCGTLMVARDSDDREALDHVFDFQKRLGLEVERLSGRECRALESGLAPGVRGGLLVAGDHQVDPAALGASLFEACRRAGVEVVETNARRVTLVDGSATGVVLDDGTELSAGVVVVAAGAWSGALGLPDGVIPVRPVKGQVVRLQGRAASVLPSRNLRGLDVYLVPRPNGEVVLGATVEERGFDPAVTAEGVYRLLDEAYEIYPGILETDLKGVATSFRPGTPDNAPVLGATRIDRLLVAGGHYRNGILLTPVTADSISDLLVTGRAPSEIAAFSARRFEERAMVSS
jgi:glycine oxidase